MLKVYKRASKRLTYDLPNLKDTKSMMDILNNSITMEHLSYMSGKDCWNEKNTTERINTQIKEAEQNKGALFHIYLEDELIGIAGFPKLNLAEKEGVFGIIIHHPYWRKGFSTEIHLELLEHGFADLHLKKVSFYTENDNQAMKKFFECYDISTVSSGNQINNTERHTSTMGESVYCLTSNNWLKIKKEMENTLSEKLNSTFTSTYRN